MKDVIWYHLYAESFLKSDTNEFIYKREKDSQTSRMNLWLSVGEGGGRDGLGVGEG